MIEYCKCGAVMVKVNGKPRCAMKLAHEQTVNAVRRFNERQAALAGAGYDKRCAPAKEKS